MRIVLAEDLALLRDGMIRLLTAYQFEVVEAVDNGPSLLRALTTHRPDVAEQREVLGQHDAHGFALPHDP